MKTKLAIIILLMAALLVYSLSAEVGRNRKASFDINNNPKSTGGIINNSARIVIQNGAYMIISGSGNYKSGGNSSVSGTGTLKLTGNFINFNSLGAPVAPNSVLHFNGTSPQSITGNPVTFGNVSFINPAGVNIGCDTNIAGDLVIDVHAGIIAMTDYDFGVSGDVSGTPDIVVTGSGAVGDVGSNANVTVDSPQPSGLPVIMNTLEVNPGATQIYNLPNSTSVANLTFSSGSLNFDSYSVLLRNHDLILSGENALSAFTATLNPIPGTFGENSSINKTWNITGQSSGDITITLRWLNSENNGNDFTSGFANVFAHDGSSWLNIGRYAITLDGSYNQVSFSRSLGAKSGNNDYTVTGDDQVLPVEMSSFTAVPAVNLCVTLNWTTQSETGMSGYYVYRNTINDLTTAQNLNHLITATNTSSEHTYSFTDEQVPETGSYFYWLQSVELNGSIHFWGPVAVTLNQQQPDTPEIPLDTELLKIYPNPFNPETKVRFSLKNADQVTISVYNCKGQLIWKTAKQYNTAGIYSMNWDGRNNNHRSIASGVYKLVFQAGDYYSQRSIVLMK